jgi:serine/threonine protein kinase
MDILKKARHRSIVSYFGSLFNDGKQYLLMEYCDGGSLYDLIHRSKETLLEAHIAFIISCVIDALYYLHGTRVVHCDVKAANILLNKNGTVKLSDFGISEMLGTHERGRIAGSPLWMAPETICGSEPTFKSDIWSLGITALELAETRPPHYGTKSLPEIIRAINESDPPTLRLPEQWSDDFRGFLALVLVKDAAKRPTAQELLRHPFVMMGRMNSPLLNQGDDSFTSYIEFGVYTYAKHFPDRLKGFDTARNRQPSSSSSTTGNLFSRLFNLTSKSLTRGESSKLPIDSSKPAPLRRESRDRSLSKDGSKSTDELSAALSSSASLSHVKLLSSSSSDSRSLTSTTSTLSNTAGLINRSVSSSALSSADIMELPRGTQLLNRRSLIPLKVLQETAALSLTNSIIQLQGDTPPRRGSVSGQSPLLGSVTSSNLLRRRKETDTVEETPEVDLLRIKSILGLQANDSPERNPATPGSDTSPKMSNSSPSSSVLPTGSPALSPMTTPSLAGRSPSFLSLKVSDATVTWRKPMLQQLLIEEDNEDYVLELENGDVLSSLPSVRTNQAVEIDHARTYVITAQGNLSTHGFEISSKGIIKSPDMHFPSEVESAGSAPSSKGVRSADANASSRFFANSAPSSNSASPSGSAPGSPLYVQLSFHLFYVFIIILSLFLFLPFIHTHTYALSLVLCITSSSRQFLFFLLFSSLREKPKRRSFSRERQTEMNNTERMAVQLCREDLVDLAVIGRGQNGNVVKALHVPSLSLVAIKTMNVFDQGTRHQLVKELAAYSKLSGPHLVSFLGAYFHDGTISLTSEFMDCGSLHHFVAVNGPLDEELLRYVTREIVLGLRYLHGARQLHRDIKPENILLDRHANVKIADFGLLRELDSEQQTANTFMGTLNYLSPERITSGTYSYPSDIWALGMTIMHAATGQMSVTTHDYWAVADSVLHKPQPSLPSTFSADLRSFVDSCLARDPAQRGSAEELLKHPFLAIPSPPDVMSRKEWNISQGANIDSLTKIVDVMLAGYFKDENGSYLRDILVESDYIYHVADTLNVPSRLVADTFLTRLQAACPGQPVTMKIVRAEAPEGDDAASSHNIGSATSTGSMLFQELDWSSL